MKSQAVIPKVKIYIFYEAMYRFFFEGGGVGGENKVLKTEFLTYCQTTACADLERERDSGPWKIQFSWIYIVKLPENMPRTSPPPQTWISRTPLPRKNFLIRAWIVVLIWNHSSISHLVHFWSIKYTCIRACNFEMDHACKTQT